MMSGYRGNALTVCLPSFRSRLLFVHRPQLLLCTARTACVVRSPSGILDFDGVLITVVIIIAADVMCVRRARITARLCDLRITCARRSSISCVCPSFLSLSHTRRARVYGDHTTSSSKECSARLPDVALVLGERSLASSSSPRVCSPSFCHNTQHTTQRATQLTNGRTKQQATGGRG